MTPRPKILTDPVPYRWLHEQLQATGELVPLDECPDDELEQIEALFTYQHPAVTSELIVRLPRLRVISNFGVGVDHIDVEAARRRNIPVGHTPGVLDKATADLGMALLLASARRIVETSPRVDLSGMAGPEGVLLGREVHASTLGIIGLGRIGRQVARRAIGFDMRVLYFQRRPLTGDAFLEGVEYCPLKDLLRQSDFVMLTLPLTPETHRFIDSEKLGWMKSSATLINIARGAIVDTAALTDALARGALAAAALDVTDPEPLPHDHPLRRMPNVIITPHIGSAADKTRRRMAELSLANLRAGLTGKPLPAAVPAPQV